MGKKVTLFALMLLSATILPAQITMKGQLQRFIAREPYSTLFDGLFYYVWDVINRGGTPLPTVKPKTYSVIIKDWGIDYDHINDEWVTDDRYYECKIVYDTIGLIKEIYWGETSDVFKSYKITSAFVYENDKLVKIMKSDMYSDLNDCLSIRYNQEGIISKIVAKQYPYIWEARVLWSSQGFLSQYKIFKDGDPYLSTISYQFSQNGRNILVTMGDEEHQIIVDKNGALERYGNEYYENTYDDNNNLIQQVQYKLSDGEKYYIKGRRFEYQYEFYE